jgi:DNA modification methylase
MNIYTGDALDVLKTMDSESVQCCVTSPPYYGLRSYLPDGVVLRDDAPGWVKNELAKLNIKPVDNRHI